MMGRTFRALAFLAAVGISAGCGGSDDAGADNDVEAAVETQEADNVASGEDDGVGKFDFTMSGAMTGRVTGTDVQCSEFSGVRMVTLRGEHGGETLDVALSNEKFDDGTFGKVIVGGYIRSAGEGGTLTIDENGATFKDLQVRAVTITGSATC